MAKLRANVVVVVICSTIRRYATSRINDSFHADDTSSGKTCSTPCQAASHARETEHLPKTFVDEHFWTHVPTQSPDGVFRLTFLDQYVLYI